MTAAFALLLDLSVKGTLICSLGLLFACLMRQKSAGLRHDVLAAALTCCALLPLTICAWWALDVQLPHAPVHEAVMAVTPHLPRATPAGAIELVDQIWSGDGGSSVEGGVSASLVLAWLAGCLFQLTRIFLGYCAARAVVARAELLEGSTAAPGVHLKVTSELSVPAMFGFRSPVILLPEDAKYWTAERAGAVLAHEAAHVRRSDAAVEMIVQLAAALHWFNPLVHCVGRKLRLERELACDEQVVAAGVDIGEYLSALLQAARDALRPHPGMLAMAQPLELERRIKLLIAGREAIASPQGAGRFLTTVTLSICLIPAAWSAPAARLLAMGSVQPGNRALSGLDNPTSERLPLDYDSLAPAAAVVRAEGPEGEAIARLKSSLLHRSRGPGDLVRERAIWALTRVRGSSVFEPLVTYVNDPDWRVRAYAAWALAAVGDRRGTGPLLEMLQDPVWRVRAMAAAALAGSADPLVGPHLVQMAGDPAWQVRVSAIDYFQKRGDPSLVDAIRPLLDDPHDGTRHQAAAALSGY